MSVPVSTAFHDLNFFFASGLVGVMVALIAGFVLALYQSAQITAGRAVLDTTSTCARTRRGADGSATWRSGS